jgi:Nidogen-like
MFVASSISSWAAAQNKTPPFRFGNATNDVFTRRGDGDFSSRVNLPQPMALLNLSATYFYQITDGYLLFNVNDSNALGYVLVFFMDIDTGNGGIDQNEVWSRAGNSSIDLNLARDIIAGTGTLFTPQSILVATWYKVEAHSRRVGAQNTFQLAMPYSATGETWAIFAYPQLQYYQSGGFNPNVASIGINDRDFNPQQTINNVASLTAMNALANGTNCNRTGIYVYRVSKGVPTNAPVSPTTVAPTPEKCGLFGWGIFCPRTFCGIFRRWLRLCQND